MWGEAEQELGKSLELAEKQNHVQFQGAIWLYRALRFLLMARSNPQSAIVNCKSAIESAQRALEFADEDARTDAPTPRDYVRAHWLLGSAYRAVSINSTTAELTLAEENLSKALNQCRLINLVSDEADILLELAQLRYAQGDFKDAQEKASEALVITERSGYVLQGADVNLFLAQYARQWELEFLPAVHVIGMHQYPFYGGYSYLNTSTMTNDVWNSWKTLITVANQNGKGILATGQGFGEGWTSMRYPSYEELRFQMYAAIVQGAPSYLWWMDTANNVSGSSNPTLVPGYVGQLMTELKTANITGIQNSPQMQAGSIVYRQVGNTIIAVNPTANTVTVSIPATGTNGRSERKSESHRVRWKDH